MKSLGAAPGGPHNDVAHVAHDGGFPSSKISQNGFMSEYRFRNKYSHCHVANGFIQRFVTHFQIDK